MKYWVLDKIFNKPSRHRQIEYVAVDKNFLILDKSQGVERFADVPDRVLIANDIRESFPELVGYEDTLIAILQAEEDSFELKGVVRSSGLDSSPLYIDIYVINDRQEENSDCTLLIIIEDVTERMVLEQTLVQRVNEANLLSSVLAASRDYIAKIITSMADALLVTTLSGTIKRVNPATINLFGYREEELIGQHISRIITDENFAILGGRPLAGELFNNADLVCQTKQGEKINVAFSCSAIQAEIEEFKEFVYVGRDISDRKRAEAEMRQALAKEKEINELKNRFISMVYHEFGNPLNAIIMSVELLEHDSEDSTQEEKLEYLHHIRKAATQMSKLLKDVLVLGKGEARKIEFNPAPIDLVKFCGEVVEQIKLSAGGKGTVKFVRTGFVLPNGKADNLPLMDEKILRHILTNLLENAIKYSPQGGHVHFHLSCQNGEAIFQIRDEGIGIPPDDLKKLFTTFHRSKNVGKIPGTGLGLAIVKQSVEIHGGQIAVASEMGVGTTFTVKIPLNNRSQLKLDFNQS